MGKGTVKARTAYKNQHIREHYDRINLCIPKGEKAKIKAAADGMGKSINEYLSDMNVSDMEKIRAISDLPLTKKELEIIADAYGNKSYFLDRCIANLAEKNAIVGIELPGISCAIDEKIAVLDAIEKEAETLLAQYLGQDSNYNVMNLLTERKLMSWEHDYCNGLFDVGDKEGMARRIVWDVKGMRTSIDGGLALQRAFDSADDELSCRNESEDSSM